MRSVMALRKLASVLLCALVPVLGASGAAQAQGRLDAQYTAYLAGIPIGSGNWVIDVGENQYSTSANGSTSGLLRAFTGGKGNSAARGTLNGGKLVSSIYAATISTRKKSEDIRLTIANGGVKDFRVDPEQDPDPDRLPVTDAHRQNVLDPMTATMLRVAGTGELLVPETCQRKVSVFDGKLRYDLELAYKRMETVKADKGYAGPALVCAVLFTPLAGHDPTRSAIKYLTKMRDMEVWLVPIAGTRVLVPFRAQGPTPVGQAVVEADQFVATPMPSRASISAPKAQ